MNPREAGFLLLGSCLGDPARHPLTPAQLQRLAANIRRQPMPAPGGEELTRSHLRALGCTEPEAAQILALLKEEDRLAPYLHRAERQQIHCLTRGNPRYPPRLITAMGDRAPAVLWFSGNLSLLQTPCLSLVGSRELRDANRAFARAAGAEMATQGYTLVSGGAGAQTSKPKRPAWPLAARSLRSWQPPVRRPLIPTSSCAGRIALTCPSPLPGPCPETGSSMP